VQHGKLKWILGTGIAFLVSACLVFIPVAYATQKSSHQTQDQSFGDLTQKITPTHTTTDTLLTEGNKLDKHIDKATGGITKFTGKWISEEIMYGITWLEFISCLILLLMVFIFERAVRYMLDKRLRKRFAHQPRFELIASLLDALSKPLSMFILVYGVFWSFSPILSGFRKIEGLGIIPEVTAKAADLAGYFAIVWFAYRLSFHLEKQLSGIVSKTQSELDDLLVPLIGKILRILVIIIGSAIIIHSLTGLNFGPMIASLGIGGAAIALAAKESIANFLGSMTIVFDKPFNVGDRIIIDNHDGVVEEVGFRSTKIRTLDGHFVTIPNEKVISTTINNISKQPYIRWLTNIAVSSDTPPEKVERAVEIIRSILRNHEGMHENLPPLVYFNAFNSISLNITVTAWYHPPDCGKYSEWLQMTCLKILKEFTAEGIGVAFPPQVTK
jgi:MscS family membrane protein